jgi:hypothetical protein
MLAFPRPCKDHRAALYAWADRRELGPGTASALGHLDRCRDCERELTQVVQMVTALARLRRELEQAEPAPDAWLRLRDRISRPVDPWRWRTSLGSLAASSLLVGVLVLPVTIGGPVTAENGSELPGPLVEIRREAEYLASIRDASLPPTPREVSLPPALREVRNTGSIPRNYPPEIARVRKEVPAQPAQGRSSQPI